MEASVPQLLSVAISYIKFQFTRIINVNCCIFILLFFFPFCPPEVSPIQQSAVGQKQLSAAADAIFRILENLKGEYGAVSTNICKWQTTAHLIENETFCVK